jgi:opacity protein-like surface antigen
MRYLLTFIVSFLPSILFALDLDDFYITPKAGISKSMNTGKTNFISASGIERQQYDYDLGEGLAFGFSVGKYVKENFRIETEVLKRSGFDFDSHRVEEPIRTSDANIETHALFINGFYDFQNYSLASKSVTPYFGVGIGLSRNKMGMIKRANISGIKSRHIDGDSITQFAYKLSLGTLINLTEKLSFDINYQYVNLGEFKSKAGMVNSDGSDVTDLIKGYNGGEIKSQEIMFGLQYKF